jgi:hypothetical protein
VDPPNQHNVMYIHLVDLRVAQDLLDGLKSATEEVLVELFESSASEGGVEINTLKYGIDLKGSLGGRGETTFGTFTSSSQAVCGQQSARAFVDRSG